MVTIIMQNKNTGEYSYISSSSVKKVKAYFDKWYSKNWKIATAIEGKFITIK